jgi:ankyrin repeat protein
MLAFLPHDVLCHVSTFFGDEDARNSIVAGIVTVGCLDKLQARVVMLYACRDGDNDLLTILMNTGFRVADITYNGTWEDYYNPVLHAISNGHSAIVQRLMDAGALINRGCMLVAAHHGYIDVVQRYLDNTTDEDFESPLTFALRQGHMDIVRVLMTKVHHFDPYKYTFPFYTAVEEGYIDVVRFYIDAGFVVPQSDTLLYDACRGGHSEIVGILLDAGLVPQERHFCVSVQRGFEEVIRTLLRVKMPEDFGVLLCHCVGTGSVGILRSLLEHHTPSPRQFTRALHRCCRKGYTDMARHLLCINPHASLRNPLHLARLYSHHDTVSFLEQHQA